MAADYFADIFDDLKHGLINTWDYQWHWAIWSCSARCILPAVNLITNVGFDVRATHSQAALSLPAREIHFPLIHPGNSQINRGADEFTFRRIYGVTRSATVRKFARKWVRRLKSCVA
jgi:hypothetical protein